jgi:hypothetical protein
VLLKTCVSAAVKREKFASRLRSHLTSALLTNDRATLTNLICMSGRSQQDWSADYRLYSRARVNANAFFDFARTAVLDMLPPAAPLVVALDDTILRKSGSQIPDIAWRRDPLGPRFQTNLVYSQRVLQFSAAVPLENGDARLVPVYFGITPHTPKLASGATPEQLVKHKETLKQRNLNTRALDTLNAIRVATPADRHLIGVGDGSYTNGSILGNLPQNTTYIGRTRKDMKLFYPPQPQPADNIAADNNADNTAAAPVNDAVNNTNHVAAAAPVRSPRGRPRVYGPRAPTPEELRKDATVPTQKVTCFAAGKPREFDVKILRNVLWEKAGPKTPLTLLVVLPVPYHKGDTKYYRRPAYLLCTDPDMDVKDILQPYLWRLWIEFNFRDEKDLVGVGQSHVRTANSNAQLPAVLVGAYALLWLAALQLLAEDGTSAAAKNLCGNVVIPKWRVSKETQRTVPSFGQLLRTLCCEYWQSQLLPEPPIPFLGTSPPDAKSPKIPIPLRGIFQTA